MAPKPNESPEVTQYFDELRKRLPGYAQRAAEVPAGAAESVEALEQLGTWWQQAREQNGLSRRQVAERMGVEINQVRFVELGLATAEDLQGEFLQRYAEALGDPELYQQYLQ